MENQQDSSHLLKCVGFVTLMGDATLSMMDFDKYSGNMREADNGLMFIIYRWHGGGVQGEGYVRAIDDSSVKYAAVLHLLQVWKQLPESDLSRMLRQYYLITDDFREMEDQGFITMTFVGDEYIITPTLLGRLWLEQYSSEENNGHAI